MIRHAFVLLLSILLTTSSMALRAQNPGFFLDNWKERQAAIPLHEVSSKTPNAPGIWVRIEPDSVINKIPPYIFGHNAVTWGGDFDDNARAQEDLKKLQAHVLRWPGGSLSNNYFWNMSPGQKPLDIPGEMNPWPGMNTEDWRTSLDEYYAMREAAGCTGIFTLNYSYARYGTSADPVGAAAHLAAEWVRYDQGRTRYWEIGNENYGSWEEGNVIDTELNQDGQPAKINGKLYGEHCRVFIDSMRAAAAEVGNDIKIGVVAFDSEDSWDPVSAVWNEQMMPEVGHLADFIIVHNYFTPHNENSTVETILNSAPDTRRIVEVIKADMADAGQAMIPMAMTEYNIFAKGSLQQVSHISGMHSALVLGEMIMDGYGMANRWDLLNGWNDGDDHGLFSRDEPEVKAYMPRPAFFYHYFWQKYMGDRLIHSYVEGSDAVVSYTSTYSSGDLGMVLVNKGRTAQTVEIDLGAFDSGNSYYTMTLTGDADKEFSRKVYLNGHGGHAIAGGPENYEVVPALAMPVEGGCRIELPALGTTFLMVEKKRLSHVNSFMERDPGIIESRYSMEVDTVEVPSGFRVLVNETQEVLIDSVLIDQADARLLHIHLHSPLHATDQVTLSFSGEAVRNAEGEALQSFDDLVVSNRLPGSPPAITQAFSLEDGSAILLKCTRDMQTGDARLSDFSFTLPPDVLAIPGIKALKVTDLSPSTLVLEMEEALVAEQVLLLSYSGSAITSTEGGVLAPFSDLEVENRSPGLPPQVSSATVHADGSAVQLEFTKVMMDLSTLADDFSLDLDGNPVAIRQITHGGFQALLFPAEGVEAGQEVLLSYQGNRAASVDRGILAPFAGLEVVNGLVAPVVHQVPGTIDLELFEFNSGMQLEDCSDEGGGQHLGYIDRGDFVDYLIEVEMEGSYVGELRVAAKDNKGLVDIMTPNADVVTRQRVGIPVTGDWQTWESVPVELRLESGTHLLRLYAATHGFALNWLKLEHSTLGPPAATSAGRIRIYPNPARELLYIHLDQVPHAPGSLRIMDMQGRTLFQETLDQQENKLSLSSLEDGLYLVELRMDGRRVLRRLVKH